jgi:hypothetical protein
MTDRVVLDERGAVWVYIREYNTYGVGYPSRDLNRYLALILPEWMTARFIAAIPEVDGYSPVFFVTVEAERSYFEMGEGCHLVITDSNPVPLQEPETKRVLIDGVLAWGMERYRGERQHVIPRVGQHLRLKGGSDG